MAKQADHISMWLKVLNHTFTLGWFIKDVSRIINEGWFEIQTCPHSDKNTFHWHWAEHYSLCLDCATVWTTYYIETPGCGHVEKDTPSIVRRGLYGLPKEIVYLDDDGDCSVCGVPTMADGW